MVGRVPLQEVKVRSVDDVNGAATSCALIGLSLLYSASLSTVLARPRPRRRHLVAPDLTINVFVAVRMDVQSLRLVSTISG